MENRFTVAALYCFARLERFRELRQPLLDLTDLHGIKGTLLLAHEGINGTVAGTGQAITELISFIRKQPELIGLELKYSKASEMPFFRMKVRLKKEIVTMGIENVDPLDIVGTYVSPEEWNKLIEDEDTIVIDTRNDYEYAVGSFKGAIDPQIKTFREFPKWVEEHKDELKKKKNIAMFCTGGIRCEKSTAYVRGLGYDNVYHLKGGILKYLEEIPEEKSLWDGECFVFDGRVTIKHGLEEGEYELCHACHRPLAPESKLSPHYEAGVSCENCYDERTSEDRQRFRERVKQIELSKQRNTEPHIGY